MTSLDKWTVKFKVDCSDFDLQGASAMLSEFSELYDSPTFDRFVSDLIKVKVVDGTFKLWFNLEELSRKYYSVLDGEE